MSQSSRRRGRSASAARSKDALLALSPSIAAYLRRGLLKEQGFAAERLSQLALSGEIDDQGAYQSTLWTIAAAQRVLARIGLSPSRPSSGVQLTKDDHPLLVYKALRAQLEIEVVRAEERAIEGRFDRAGVDGELESVVGLLRKHLGNSARTAREARLSGSVAETRIIASHIERSRA